MAKSKEQCVNEFLSALPAANSYSLVDAGYESLELRSPNCVIRFSFDRGNTSSCITELVDPRNPERGMHLLLLLYLRGVTPTPNTARADFGRMVATIFPDVLSGDFRIQSQYDAVETPFFNYLDIVKKLPTTHPTRVLYENHDLRWISEIQNDLRSTQG